MFAMMIKSEIKNVLREKMTIVMLIWPLFFGGLGYMLIQRGIVHGDGIALTAILMTVIAGFLFGAMSGFSLLDDRDDQVLESIQISPVPVQWYIWFKICFAYILAIFAGVFMIWATEAIDLGVADILLVTSLSALQVPIIAFIINAYAKNKVEGFVTMKGTGFLIIFPAAAFFFLDAKEWLFSFAPAHWVAKAVQYSMLEPMIDAGLVEMNLGFYQYLGIGFAWNLLLVAGAYKLFKRKNLL